MTLTWDGCRLNLRNPRLISVEYGAAAGTGEQEDTPDEPLSEPDTPADSPVDQPAVLDRTDEQRLALPMTELAAAAAAVLLILQPLPRRAWKKKPPAAKKIIRKPCCMAIINCRRWHAMACPSRRKHACWHRKHGFPAIMPMRQMPGP
mgnify:CR=1 FL=1